MTIVRVCPKHKAVLRAARRDRLRCDVGRHIVDEWLVVDVETSTVLARATRSKGATAVARGSGLDLDTLRLYLLNLDFNPAWRRARRAGAA
jgi:hypothetical protein